MCFAEMPPSVAGRPKVKAAAMQQLETLATTAQPSSSLHVAALAWNSACTDKLPSNRSWGITQKLDTEACMCSQG